MPVALFDLCASFLVASERFTLVERVCRHWHHCSAHQGAGWAGAWDLLRLPESTRSWSATQLLLKNRMQSHRVTRLRCRYSQLLDDNASAAAAAAAGPPCVFAHCTHLTLVNDTGVCDLSALDLRVAFPQARRLHLALTPLSNLEYFNRFDQLSATDDDVEILRGPNHSELQRMVMDVGEIVSRANVGTVLLPELSHIEHLRLSSALECSVPLHTEWPRLESFGVYGLVKLMACTHISMPSVSRLTFSTRVTGRRASVFGIIKAAPALVALFFYSIYMTADEVGLLRQHCPALRTLHCCHWDDEMELAKLSTLTDLALCSYEGGFASMDAVVTWLMHWLVDSQIQRFAIIERDPYCPPAWHSAVLPNAARTSVAYLGHFVNN